jgi:hypothetical protein
MLTSWIMAGVALVTLTLFTAEAGPKSLVWQSAQIVSMKEEVSDRDANWTSYVYGLHGKDVTYAVVVSTPLKAYIHNTVRFAIDKNLLYIQDVDGKVRKACIVEQSKDAPHR